MTHFDEALPRAIEVAAAADGSLLYVVAGTPATLPAVLGRDLLGCWDAARILARDGQWGRLRRFRFLGTEDSTDIVLTDRDATSWAEAVDARIGLHSRYGLSLCLRLLALVDLLARCASIRGMVHIKAGAAELAPALVRAAATWPLDPDARFTRIDLLAAAGGAWHLLAHPAEPDP